MKSLDVIRHPSSVPTAFRSVRLSARRETCPPREDHPARWLKGILILGFGWIRSYGTIFTSMAASVPFLNRTCRFTKSRLSFFFSSFAFCGGVPDVDTKNERTKRVFVSWVLRILNSKLCDRTLVRLEQAFLFGLSC